MSPKLVAIDNLHDDALREILIRVAGSPNGAADLARAFAVCKAFQKFSEDGDVLRAVVFDNLSVSCRSGLDERNSQEFNYQAVYSQYEPFQHVGGLIKRSAHAGHPGAQFILAKIVMVSASELYRGYSESFLADDNLRTRHAKNEILKHFNLVRMFLTQESFIELENMKPFLKDFVRYFLDPKNEAHYKQFCLLFEKLSEAITLLLETSAAIFGHLGLNPQQLLDVALLVGQKFDCVGEVGAENLIQQVEIALNNEEEEEANRVLYAMMGRALEPSVSRIKKRHLKLIAKFDALFGV